MNRFVSRSLILIIFFINCSSQKIFFKKEYEIESLNLNEDQREFVSAKLDTIYNLTNDYNSVKSPDFEEIKDKSNILSLIFDKILKINEILTEEQLQIFRNSELVTSSVYSGQKLLTSFNKKRKLRKYTHVNGLKNTETISSDEEFSLKWNNNTVIIGGSGFRGGFPGGRMMMPGGGRSAFLPVNLRATLLDKSLTSYLSDNKYHQFKDDNNIHIFISISTNLHNSYLNLNKWIIYLENNKLEKSELSEFTEKEKRPEIKDELEEFTEKFREISRFSLSTGVPGRLQVNSYRLTYGRKFYIISFKNDLIQNNPEFIKLVFLEEIGSNIKDEGRWYFKEY